MYVSILSPVHGAILNRHDGKQTDTGLEITVQGVVEGADCVTVNGIPAHVVGSTFAATCIVAEPQVTLTAEAVKAGESVAHRVTVLWDRYSFPRYRLSLDDNIYFLRDIAKEQPVSLFDNWFLAFWRNLHRRYGTKTHINLYYECEDFNLSQMPVRYKAEWQDNAHWLKLSFHARADVPAEPYKEASAAQLLADYRQVKEQVLRFAGEEVWSNFTTLHWGTGTRAACRALRQEEGVWGLAGYFIADEKGARVNYYLDYPTTAYLYRHDYWKDLGEDLIFVTHDLVINLKKTPEEVVAHLEEVAHDPHRAEILELMIHEQYFRKILRHYQPNAMAKVEAAVHWVTERGYKPVLYDEGFLGA